MTTLKECFTPICREAEIEIKKNLRGLAGGIIRGYLPQLWIFKTENETVSFRVDNNGNTSVIEGSNNNPDVIIEIEHNYLVTALQTRSQPNFQPQFYDVKAITQKGQTAFGFLKKRFGL